MNYRARGQIRVSARDRHVPTHRGALAQIQIAAQRRQITRNFATRIDIDLPEHHRNVPRHISMDMNGTEQARNITRRLSFFDGDITANTGAVLGAFGECRNSGDKNKYNSEEQFAHKKDLVG
ncbi:MAG TPA: hypothetical protein VHS13_13125 [Edaphobacter sp.]|jgi:hypothetical protein|nr:hypothetical protein [Edaphobacter sp.]